MKNYYFSRKRRQLKYIAKRIRILLAANNGQRNEKIDRLAAKLVKMIKSTRQIISGRELAKSLGTAALLFGLAIANPAAAQNYAPAVENPFQLESVGIFSVTTFGDIDGDGDTDMMTGTYDTITGGSLRYYENVGTAGGPEFAAPTTNPFGIQTPNSVLDLPTFGDLDGDGDLDVLSIGVYGNFRYWENTGTATAPAFGLPDDAPLGLDSVGYFSKPTLVDMDADGDLDLMVGEAYFEDANGNEYYGDFKYYENTGTATAPQFAEAVRNPFGLTSSYYFNFATVGDVDSDGDMDILTAEYYGVIQYYENTGTASAPAFAAAVEGPFGIDVPSNLPDADEAVIFPTLVDLDNDSDLDIMVGKYFDTFSYLENMITNPTGVKDLAPAFDLEVFPNPVQNRLLIRTAEDLQQIEIVDMLGRTVDRHLVIDNSISVDHLLTGVYLLRATDKNGNVVLKKIEKL